MRAYAIGGVWWLWLAGTAGAAPAGDSAPPPWWTAACTYCHDAQIAPSLLGRHLDPATIVAIVRNGLPAMPAFHRSEISDADLLVLAKWVARQPAPPPPVPPPR
jgi:cytochrome c553